LKSALGVIPSDLSVGQHNGECRSLALSSVFDIGHRSVAGTAAAAINEYRAQRSPNATFVGPDFDQIIDHEVVVAV
jgi:hypothetical protein